MCSDFEALKIIKLQKNEFFKNNKLEKSTFGQEMPLSGPLCTNRPIYLDPDFSLRIKLHKMEFLLLLEVCTIILRKGHQYVTLLMCYSSFKEVRRRGESTHRVTYRKGYNF